MDGKLTEEKANFSDYKQVKHDLMLMAKVANVLRVRFVVVDDSVGAVFTHTTIVVGTKL